MHAEKNGRYCQEAAFGQREIEIAWQCILLDDLLTTNKKKKMHWKGNWTRK